MPPTDPPPPVTPTAKPASRPAAPTSRPSPSGGTTSPPADTKQRTIAPRERREVAAKWLFMASEGFGKTTFAAQSPSPLLLMTPGESGYDTLLSAGRVPAIPAYELESWEDLLGWCDSLLADPQGIKTLAIDELKGVEALCHDFEVRTTYKGDRSKFMSYHKGYESAINTFRQLLVRLERLNRQHGMQVILLSHLVVKNHKHPLVADFDRYVPAVHEKTKREALAWCDACLFGTFQTHVATDDADGITGKGKGIGGTDRVIHTEYRDGWDAKNRFGLKPTIAVPNDPTQVWPTVWNALQTAIGG